MRQGKINNNFLESFVDAAAELLAHSKNHKNNPTPSLNKFSNLKEPEQNIVITSEEAEQILNILKNFQNELESKEEQIASLKNKLAAKKEKPPPKDNFKYELIEHAENLDLVVVLIQTGGDCCDIQGNVFRVHEDFVVLLGQDNSLIKILLNKIAAIKVINNKKSREKDDFNEDENNKCIVKEVQEKNSEQKIKAI
ncbi:MAG: hypothetical protein ACQERJ_05345 [Bacillota bacterium]